MASTLSRQMARLRCCERPDLGAKGELVNRPEFRLQLHLFTRDRTGAQDMLDAYHEAIGGEPEPPSTKAAASKRTSTGARSKRARDPTPDEPAPKRTKRASRAKSEDNDDEDNDEDEDDKDNKQYSATQRQQDQKVREFLKTEVDWEKKVKYVHSVEHRKSDDPKKPKNGRLVVAIAFDDGTRDGLKTLVLMRAARERCPQRVSASCYGAHQIRSLTLLAAARLLRATSHLEGGHSLDPLRVTYCPIWQPRFKPLGTVAAVVMT